MEISQFRVQREGPAPLSHSEDFWHAISDRNELLASQRNRFTSLSQYAFSLGGLSKSRNTAV